MQLISVWIKSFLESNHVSLNVDTFKGDLLFQFALMTKPIVSTVN